MRVDLSRIPSAPKTYVVDFPRLTGGLKLDELDYRLNADQSPEMKNLWWQDGLLQCRDGQVRLDSGDSLGTGYTCFGSLFWGHAFFHIGDKLFYGDPTGDSMVLTELITGVPERRGTFFRYMDWLFYKNRGGFYRIKYQPEEETPFLAEPYTEWAYTPVIQLNTDPVTGAGDSYQPENRLSGKKTVRFNAAAGVKTYHLPVKNIDSVDKVLVDGKVTSDYEVNLEDGIIEFTTAPPVTTPATNNTVEVTFTKSNADALKSVLDCEYAIIAGGDTNLCILLAGCKEQPNAVFWSDRDNLSMNPGYFPITYYNLVGDTEDPVTGFGRQYSDLIVLKEHSLGKLVFDTEDLDGRNSIVFRYNQINGKVGCDLPWSIQLIENNLVFCNTYQGVHILRSSSAAYENNVECISRNVNSGTNNKGLLQDVRQVDVVTSFDDDSRYWLCANSVVYVWDYSLSSFSNPSWFYFTAIPGVAYFHDDEHRKYHLNTTGWVTRFERVFSDYQNAIEKLYRFPTQSFGSYDRLKDIESILATVRSDTDTNVTIRYETDYETRQDLTPIQSYSWRLSPRNLAFRRLAVAQFAHTVRRKPGCRHIRHFSMTFSNSDVGCDLAIVSAQIFYKFQGKER